MTKGTNEHVLNTYEGSTAKCCFLLYVLVPGGVKTCNLHDLSYAVNKCLNLKSASAFYFIRFQTYIYLCHKP